MNRTKLLTGLVIALVILNLVLLTFLWAGRPDAHRMRSSGQGNVENYLKRRLELSKEQAAAFTRSRELHANETKKLRSEIKRQRRQAITLLSEDADSLAMAKVVRNINRKNGRLEYINLHHLKMLREICTPEQKQKFDKIIDQIIGQPLNERQRRRGER